MMHILPFVVLSFFFLPLPAQAAVSCAEYTQRLEYSQLHEIIPSDATAEERCLLIPSNCGRSWMLFNPQGQKTYYFKSQCYHKLAVQTLDEQYCDAVIERTSPFLDGSYYSPDACRNKIRTIKADAAAPKMEATHIHRIDHISTLIEAGELEVHVALTDSAIRGEYALSVLARYQDSRRNTHVSVALNPDGENIRFDKSYARFTPVNHWILRLEPQQQAFTFTIPRHSFADTASALVNEDVTLVVQLQFIRSDEGVFADQKNRAAYISKGSVTLQP